MNLVRRAADPLAGGFQDLTGSNRSTKNRESAAESQRSKPMYELEDRHSLSSLLQALEHDENWLD